MNNLDSLPDELVLGIVTRLDIKELEMICNTSKKVNQVCKQNKTYIRKSFVKRYIPDYRDKTNFMYVVLGARYLDYDNLFKLYIRYYDKTHITYNNRYDMTSFAIFPNAQFISLNNCKLSSFPVQVSMTVCLLESNELTSFPVQPNMVECNLSGNKLVTFPVQPEMEYCKVSRNELVSFPVQPNMVQFYGLFNNIVNFPKQPKMRIYLADETGVEYNLRLGGNLDENLNRPLNDDDFLDMMDL